jgi:hypothetical protein
MNSRSLTAFLFLLSILSLAHGQGSPAPAKPGNSGSAPAQPQTALTPAQLAKVKEILSPYKANSLTVDDAKAIKRNFRDAGMRPGPALAEAVRTTGFSLQKMEELDPRPSGPPGSPPEGDRARPPANEQKAVPPVKK